MRDGLGAVQRVLLLGGASEIGLATVKELAKSGRLRHVYLAVRSVESGDAAQRELASLYPSLTITPLLFDAADQSTFEPMLNKAFSEGEIDCVISAFGLLGNDVAPLADVAGVNRLLQVNYVAAVITGTRWYSASISRKRHVGLLSSVAAERSRFDNYVYASTKAGVDSWASGLADALKGVALMSSSCARDSYTKMTTGLPVAPLATTPDQVAVVIVEAIKTHKPSCGHRRLCVR